MNRQYLQEASLGLAVMDALPVLFFCGTIALLGMIWGSPLFLAGGICCILAGAGKVLWKLILALSGKSLLILNRQFRFLMSGGFLLMLLALLVGRDSISFSAMWRAITWFPGNLCFLIGLCGMVLMGVLAAKLDHASKRANWLEQSVNLIAQLAIFLGVLLIWYGGDCYAADTAAMQATESTDSVTVTELSDGLLFDGEGTDTALIFYPGAKVEYTAYAPLMQRLAEDGIDCFLLEMPYNLAIFGKNRAADIMENSSCAHWYLAGHSLGGAMAASYAAGYPDGLDGLILLAAYPTKALPDGLQVLTLYGSEDGVLSMEKLEAGEQYLPESAVTICIEGGNHAGFGGYGAQDGDGEATISAEEQQEQTAEQIVRLCRE